jgi:hypothetical protein
MYHRILSILTLLVAVVCGPAEAAPPASPSPASRADGPAAGKDLAEALQELSTPSGVRFRVAPDVAHDRIQVRVSGTTWPEVIRDLLRGYNYVGTWNAAGRLTEVLVTGRNGDGALPPMSAAAAPAAGDLFSYRGAPAPAIPARYRSYASGSVFPIEVPVERLRAMEKGTRVSVNLPNGRYELIHDNVWRHDNGDMTWVGYMDVPQGRYRALLTLGDKSLAGQILTPDGLYKLESDGPQTWLVDIAASGLQQVSFANDERDPAGMASGNVSAALPKMEPTAEAKALKGREAKWAARATVNKEGKTIIDVMLLYTPGLASPTVFTTLNNLMALANQALADSRINTFLRLAVARRVAYPNASNNSATLDDLSYFAKSFAKVPGLRNRYRADAVILVRPFRPNAQGNSCGIAWVNGSGGTEVRPDQAFGVIGYGSRGGYYCSDYALAHEMGHIMGASHDRQHANVPGKFPYSYGYGIEGRFGDVMSYYDPEVGLFANPALDHQCDGSPCGIPAGSPGEADVALTFGQTAAIVSGFVQAGAP